jgi:hypothetical protein
MQNTDSRRGAGLALAGGGVALVVAVLLHAPQPSTLEALQALDGTKWAASHWLIVAGALLLTTGLVGLSFAVEGAGRPAAALFGRVGALVSGTLFVLVGGLETMTFTSLAAADSAAAGTFLAINAVVLGAAGIAFVAFWSGIVATCFAILVDARWPQWVAISGVLIGVTNVGLTVTGMGSEIVQMAANLVGFAWVAAVGVLLYRSAGADAAPGARMPASEVAGVV